MLGPHPAAEPRGKGCAAAQDLETPGKSSSQGPGAGNASGRKTRSLCVLSALGHRHQDLTANPASKYFIGSVRGQERSWSWDFDEGIWQPGKSDYKHIFWEIARKLMHGKHFWNSFPCWLRAFVV